MYNDLTLLRGVFGLRQLICQCEPFSSRALSFVQFPNSKPRWVSFWCPVGELGRFVFIGFTYAYCKRKVALLASWAGAGWAVF